MDLIAKLLTWLDPVLIFPYRLVNPPMLGWWTGTAVLAFWSVLFGELTLALAYYVNRKAVSRNLDQTLYYHEQSLKAKQAGDEHAYAGINKLANEAYGKSFFLLMAMGMASLWPAFLAAAWLQRRFSGIVFSLPSWAGGFDLSFLAPFVILYVAMRLLYSRLKKRLRQPASNCSTESVDPQPAR